MEIIYFLTVLFNAYLINCIKWGKEYIVYSEVLLVSILQYYNFSDEIMEAYNSSKIFSIELMNDKEFEVEKYFDVTSNEWNLERYPEKISEAYDLCIGSENIDKYVS